MYYIYIYKETPGGEVFVDFITSPIGFCCNIAKWMCKVFPGKKVYVDTTGLILEKELAKRNSTEDSDK
jgi:hypothetical protein